MPGIGDILASIFGMQPGSQDPRDQIIAQALGGGGNPSGGGGGGDFPPPPPAPKGVPSPFTEPTTGPVPASMQSPPDLANMYLKLLQKTENANRMDEGLTTIAAALALDENKPGLLRMAENAGNRDAGISMTDIINLQKMQDEQAMQAQQAGQLGALGQQYNLDPATLQYLHSSGQLPDVIKELAAPDTEVVESADGSKKLIKSTTGETIRELSGAKPRATEYVKKGDGTQVLVYTDDKTEVRTGKQVTDIAAEVQTEIVKAADGSNQLIDKKDGKVLGIVTPAEEPGTVQLERADGSKALINEKTGEVVKELSPPKEGMITTQTLADGRIQAIQDGKPVGEPFGPEEAETATDDIKEYNAYAAAEKAAGRPVTAFDEWYRTFKKLAAPAGAKNFDVGTGQTLPDPPTDTVWDFSGPGGAVKRDANGAPVAIPITGSKTQKEAADAAKKAEKKAVGVSAAAAEQIQDIDSALEIMDEEGNFPTAGPIGSLIGNIPFAGAYTPQGRLATRIGDITSRISLQELQRLISESERGASGLGQVTNYEQQLLARMHGSIRQGMHPDDLRRNLKRYKRFIQEITLGEITPDSELAKDIEANTESPDEDKRSEEDLKKEYGVK